jgi:predicted short-subunit dehydrogenase-like oxidoreductase (DUF2520 family)
LCSFIVVPRPLPAAALVVRRRYCVEGTSSLRPAVARGAAQVVERGAQAVARVAATLSQQEKNKSPGVQWKGVNFARV